MTSSYREAELVTIWAGDGDSKMEESLEKTREFAFAIARCPPMRTQGFVVLGMYSRHLEDYEALFQRQWFTRTWTLQEVLLARSARLVCGRSIKSWDELATVYLRCPEECQSSIGVVRRASLGYGALKPFGIISALHSRNWLSR